MNATTLLTEIEQAAGEIWMEGERLKFRAVPARLIPLIRENKAALLALLAVPHGVRSTTDATPTTTMQPAPRKPPLPPHELAMPWQHRKAPPDECPCCKLSRFWKLRTGPPGTPWVCWRCHPPLDSMDIVIITK